MGALDSDFGCCVRWHGILYILVALCTLRLFMLYDFLCYMILCYDSTVDYACAPKHMESWSDEVEIA
jgi:hypothetical protein